MVVMRKLEAYATRIDRQLATITIANGLITGVTVLLYAAGGSLLS